MRRKLLKKNHSTATNTTPTSTICLGAFVMALFFFVCNLQGSWTTVKIVTRQVDWEFQAPEFVVDYVASQLSLEDETKSKKRQQDSLSSKGSGNLKGTTSTTATTISPLEAAREMEHGGDEMDTFPVVTTTKPQQQLASETRTKAAIAKPKSQKETSPLAVADKNEEQKSTGKEKEPTKAKEEEVPTKAKEEEQPTKEEKPSSKEEAPISDTTTTTDKEVPTTTTITDAAGEQQDNGQQPITPKEEEQTATKEEVPAREGGEEEEVEEQFTEEEWKATKDATDNAATTTTTKEEASGAENKTEGSAVLVPFTPQQDPLPSAAGKEEDQPTTQEEEEHPTADKDEGPTAITKEEVEQQFTKEDWKATATTSGGKKKKKKNTPQQPLLVDSDGKPSLAGLPPSLAAQYRHLTTQDWDNKPPIYRYDMIKEPFDPSIATPTASIKPDSPYTYAMMCWLSNPSVSEAHPIPAYKAYLANMLVARKTLLDHGSKADFNAIFKMDYNSPHQRLPPEDHEMMEKLGIKVSYLPKTMDSGNFFVLQFNKFELWNMTQYERILYLDGDVQPLNNLDYMFELSSGPNAVLKPNVVLSGYTEPANGGFFMLEPNAGRYKEIRSIIEHFGKDAGRKKPSGFDPVQAFGHAIQPPDLWETNKGDYKGTKFTFHGAHTDQGLLYSYLKYNVRNMTQLFTKRIVDFGANTDGTSTVKERTLKVREPSDSPFANHSQPLHSWWPASCGKMGWVFGSKPGCVPPYRDHSHYTGEKKPWKFAKPTDLWKQKEPPSEFYIWWRYIDKLQKDDGINIQFKTGTKTYKVSKK